MTDFFPTSTKSNTTVVPMAAGDFVYVAPNVTLIDTDTSLATATIFGTSYGSAIIDGAVVGDGPVFFEGASGGTTEIQIGGAGSVASFGFAAVEVGSYPYDISNSGSIVADQGAGGIRVNSGGVIRNYGTIDAAGNGVENDDISPGEGAYLYNYGTIGSASDGVADFNGHSAFVFNYGAIIGGAGSDAVFADSSTPEALVNSGTITGGVSLGGALSSVVNSGAIDGPVDLLGAGSSLNSVHGSISGTITCGAGGDKVIAGQSGGAVIGGSGDDVLRANPTLAAADAGAETTLDGGAGNNRLVGDGAYTTFDSGDAAGGINHIVGRLSKMPDVAGYSNNTVSYASLAGPAQSVYVSLPTGVAYTCSAANALGDPISDYTFEDHIKNVPNVIGSSGADVIVCDNGVDQITGGGGGDNMYAGAGAGSQDTFVYTAMTDSTQTHEDVIHGFKAGVDKIDFSALNAPSADIVLKYAGAGVTNVFIEQNPVSGFNAATDLVLSVHASTSTALTASSIIS